jgi:hypothetical protein
MHGHQVGNLDYLEASGLINFEKILLVYEVLSDVTRWQRECKDFKIKLSDKVPPVTTLTQSSIIISWVETHTT